MENWIKYTLAIIGILILIYLFISYYKKNKNKSKNKDIIYNVHQTYKDNILPPNLQFCKNSVHKYMNNYKYHFWTDKDMYNFIETKYPEYNNLFNYLTPKIKKIDFFKYLVIYEYGGFYIDLDMEIFKDPTDLINKDVIIGSPAIFYSIPKHPFWLQVFKYIKNNPDKHVLESTGPKCLENVYKEYKEYNNDVTILNSIVFFPIEYENSAKEKCIKEQNCREKYINKSYGCHQYEGSWLKN
jgi:mannosyltransferase OCH1-like enzyme